MLISFFGRILLSLSKSSSVKVLDKLHNASGDRVFRIYDAMRIGIPTKKIHEITKIDYYKLLGIDNY